MHSSRRLLALWFLLLVALPVGLAAAQEPDRIDFNDQVRPILSNSCFACHGPDEKHRQADLRLDDRKVVTADRGGYAAIVPGQPAESHLLERVTAADPDQRMPPVDSNRPPLSDEQIAILRQWIEQGADYKGHWAFQPLSAALPPAALQNHAWPLNPIDAFILARLERRGIAPSPLADRATLIRRVSLDLLGLLPTPEEVAAFVQDPDPAAYEKLVDRLLASPHYGERWGRHWLDQARYADSNGYTIDSARGMWPYRDWVIKALNDDMPFDQFTTEQLAGDLLADPSKNQLVATAFHRNTLINEEGGVDAEQFRHEAVVDRTNTTGAVWLGLTIGCAQCHTHKFDPISHRQYYELFAFFNRAADVNNKGATITVSRGEVFGTNLVSADRPPTAELSTADQQQWEQMQLKALEAASEQAVSWQPARYLEYDTKTGAGFQLLEDNSLLSDGGGAFNDTYRVTIESDLPQIAAVRLRVLTHESLPKRGPGRAANGNFVLTDFQLHAQGQQQKWSAAHADHQQPNYPVSAAIDQDPKSGWAINVAPGSPARLNADHEAVFVLSEPVPATGQQLEFQLFHGLNENYLVGRFALDVAQTAPAAGALISSELAEALRRAPADRTTEQAQLVQQAFERATAAPAVASKAHAAASDTADLMIMRRSDTPRQTFIYQRGDFLRPDENVGPLQPSPLDSIPPDLPAAEHLDRLDLAQWLVDPRNPLTSRVTVNRIWMRYFGRGLVETEDDFGMQGTLPTHPQLLDWLAGQLIDRDWSLKSIHRLMVTSATYRQSSHARVELAQSDPRNLLLARQNRLRVEAEIVRDAALSASGLLQRTIGGPSVHPPQPEGVYAFTQNDKRWVAETGGDRYRRAIYTTFYRSAPYPLMTTFDTPDFQTVCTRRPRSNTPLQALTVANDQAFLETAQGLAARVIRDEPQSDVTARIQRVFALCLCRQPSARELEVLEAFYQRQLEYFRAQPQRAPLLLSPELNDLNSDTTTAAALVSISRAVLNTDNFITRE